MKCANFSLISLFSINNKGLHFHKSITIVSNSINTSINKKSMNWGLNIQLLKKKVITKKIQQKHLKQLLKL